MERVGMKEKRGEKQVWEDSLRVSGRGERRRVEEVALKLKRENERPLMERREWGEEQRRWKEGWP